MERRSSPLAHPPLQVALLCGLGLLVSNHASAQVRTKAPDRGVYQSPVVGRETGSASPRVAPLDAADTPPPNPLTIDAEPVVLQSAPVSQRGVGQRIPQPSADVAPAKWGAPLVDTEFDDLSGSDDRIASSAPPTSVKTHSLLPSPVRDNSVEPVAHRSTSSAPTPLRDPGPSKHQSGLQPVSSEEVWLQSRGRHADPTAHFHYDHSGAVGSGIEQMAVGYPIHEGDLACDAWCDGGCDSLGCESPLPFFGAGGATLSLSPERWFWSAELMTMHRKGSRIPALVTTGPSTDVGTAGELNQVDTSILSGRDVILDDVTVGGSFTLGTWLDNCQNRSLVFRGWIAGKEDYQFSADQNSFPVITRPFLNVSDNQTPEQDTQLVAFPGRTDGNIHVRAESSVYGGDLSIRQLWWNQLGLRVDLFYGYQHMRMDESLGISSTSVSLDPNFAPLGSILAINDNFDVENSFHGGQLGLASLYREGCWSMRSLAKIGFGSLRREAHLRGNTLTSVGNATAIDNNGLLVRSTNQGHSRDHTFGWVPELDFTLGWHRYPRFDVTVGYHLVAMTDALQVAGMIDPSLAVNLADPPTGQQRPSRGFQYDTFYIQGIHVGLAYVY